MARTLNVEEVDLASLTEALRARIGAELPEPELPGRTILRDAVTELLDCSMLEAETVVDTLVARGFVRPEGAPERPLWQIG